MLSASETTAKRKLTLSVDEKVVDKAKELGLNLSEVTENVLRSFAFVPNETEKEALYAKYQELCDTMRPLLKEYDVSVKVAEGTLYDDKENPMGTIDISLLTDGTFWIDDFEQSLKDIHQIETYDFLEPRKILSNFIGAIADAKARRKERLEELEMAKRIIAAIDESTRKRSQREKESKRSKDITDAVREGMKEGVEEKS